MEWSICIIHTEEKNKKWPNMYHPLLWDIPVRNFSCVSSLNFTKVQAEEFLEVYKGVIPDYMDHVIELCSGLSIALEIRAENAVETFRSTAGPWDIEMAKEIRPLSIRGLYGETKVRSAIHCTDLPIDAAAECEYCFHILE